MPKRILAERVPGGVDVWYEGDDIRSFYEAPPKWMRRGASWQAMIYHKWAALADEQAKEREAA